MLEISFRSVIEFVPIMLAIISSVVCGQTLYSTKDAKTRIGFIIATTASVLMFLAQTSWFTVFLEGQSSDGFWVSVLWSVVDALIVTTFIVLALSTKKK